MQAELHEAYRQADVMAGLDHITGVANRRMFDKELKREWRRATREQGSLSLLMIDVDFFKKYNDHYGHVSGDDCLRMIGSILSKTMMRTTDLAARYGGEEFAVLLPGSQQEGARLIAERLRQAVARAGLPHAQSHHGHVTISIGVASTHPSRNTHETQILLEADKALYTAKEMGRNQIWPTLDQD